MSHDFLFELGCEELPSGAVWPLASHFAEHLTTALTKLGLSYQAVKPFATPRRFALILQGLQEEAQRPSQVRRGPALAAAYDKAGKPTQALLGFAKSCEVEVAALTTLETDKGSWVVYESPPETVQTESLLPSLIKEAIQGLPIAKPMRWGEGDEAFVRPVHWAIVLYGDRVIPMELLGVVTSNQSYGHRFHYAGAITIHNAAAYEAALQQAYVMADFAKRQQLISAQIETLAASIQALAVVPQELLDEITSIVEWPKALLAQFEPSFLEVPAECLIASLQQHQKCIALKDKQGQLLAQFITVSNIESSNIKQVISGNEKVVRARLSDAAFFFTQDKKRPLSTHYEATKQVIFQEKLGSLWDKTQRLKLLMQSVAPQYQLDEHLVNKALELSKCDLLTGMVGEFPELEGIMGYYYATLDKEDSALALALKEQYLPRFAGDELPSSALGRALSLADRIDTLVGIFAIGLKPTGVKDPFKLRRHAQAIVRILLDSPTSLSLDALLSASLQTYKNTLQAPASLLSEIKTFVLERVHSYYQGLGFSTEWIRAARARQEDCLPDLHQRILALQDFVSLPEAQALAAACKRVSNLLQQTEAQALKGSLDEKSFIEEAEKNLFQHLQQVKRSVEPLYISGDYGALLKQLASLKEPLDLFFDKVMVMVEDPQLRHNRLILLQQVQAVLQSLVDISLL